MPDKACCEEIHQALKSKVKTTGYIPSDTEERRIMKARCFAKSMVSKGQSEKEAARIAAEYYHVGEDDVKYRSDDGNDDIYFFCNSTIPVAASEIFNEGDFF